MHFPIPLLATIAISTIALVGCSGSGSTNGGSDSIDRQKAIADCGIMVRIVSGDVEITPESLDDVDSVLRKLAADGSGEVKNTAQFVLDSVNGKSDQSGEEVLSKFKEFCRDYTVDE